MRHTLKQDRASTKAAYCDFAGPPRSLQHRTASSFQTGPQRPRYARNRWAFGRPRWSLELRTLPEDSSAFDSPPAAPTGETCESLARARTLCRVRAGAVWVEVSSFGLVLTVTLPMF